MTVVRPKNVLQGSGTLYWAETGAAEPAKTAAGFAADPASGVWTPVGATGEGVQIEFGTEVIDIVVDEVKFPVGAVNGPSSVTITASLAEGTLENLALATGGTITTDATSGLRTLELNTGDQVDFKALLFDGLAPAATSGGAKRRRRFIVRKVAQVGQSAVAYKRADKTLVPISMKAYYVDDSTPMLSIIDPSDA